MYFKDTSRQYKWSITVTMFFNIDDFFLAELFDPQLFRNNPNLIPSKNNFPSLV